MSRGFYFDSAQTGLIIGGGHGLGLALAEVLAEAHQQLKLTVTYRLPEQAQGLRELSERFPERIFIKQLDPLAETEIASLSEQLKLQFEKIDFMLNAVGFLHDAETSPERALKELSLDSLVKAFQINACVFPLLAKHLSALLPRESPSVLVGLSAKVGSIEDNYLGGWYSYRASKAALNMLVKNLAIELKRNYPKLSVLAIHPGTTRTALSEPFLKRVKHQVWEPQAAALNILRTIESGSAEGTGLFKNWDGETIAW